MHTSDKMQQCIQECQTCSQVCLEEVPHCLEKGGKHAQAQHIVLLLDCAESCRTSADFMMRGSAFHQKTCEICAEVCEACAKSCDSMMDDPEMKRCAEECRRCAQSCREMAGVASFSMKGNK